MSFRADSLSHGDHVQERTAGVSFNPDWFSDIRPSDLLALNPTRTREASTDLLDFNVSIPGYPGVENATALGPNEAELPEQRLEEILTNIPSESSPEFLDRKFEIPAILSDQLDIAEAAMHEYQDYPGLAKLIPQSQKEYEKAYYALSPEMQANSQFIDNLSTLPKLVYSGQTDLASAKMGELLSDAGEKGRAQLLSYFAKLQSVASENPQLVGKYTQLFQSYNQELGTFDAMNAKYKASPFHQD